jgi:hypothetical protein
MIRRFEGGAKRYGRSRIRSSTRQKRCSQTIWKRLAGNLLKFYGGCNIPVLRPPGVPRSNTLVRMAAKAPQNSE